MFLLLFLNIIIILLIANFSHQLYLRNFHKSLSDRKSPQVSSKYSSWFSQYCSQDGLNFSSDSQFLQSPGH